MPGRERAAGDPSSRPGGIARTNRDPQRPAEAEIAVAVVDAWHRRGVGRQLVTAVALPENDAVLGLLRAVFPVCFSWREDDALVLVAVLDRNWTITMDDILADLAC